MRWSLLPILCVLALAAGHVQAAPAKSPAARGRETFVRAGCFECHDYQGQGGAGARLAPGPMPYEALAAFVRGTTGAMPAYSVAILSDADLTDIYAYLQSIPKPPALETIPALKDLKDTN